MELNRPLQEPAKDTAGYFFSIGKTTPGSVSCYGRGRLPVFGIFICQEQMRCAQGRLERALKTGKRPLVTAPHSIDEFRRRRFW
jgi:hypothetical protein